MSELKIVAKITIKAEFQKDLEVVFHKVVDATRKEEGNISYDLHQSISNPLEYTILEVWKSQQAIDFHNDSPHFSDFKKGIDGKIDGLSIDVITKVY